MGDDRRFADFQEPLLQVDGSGSVTPDFILLNLISRWVQGDRPTDEQSLARLFDGRMGGAAPVEPQRPATEEVEEFVVAPLGRSPDWDYQVAFDNSLPIGEEGRLPAVIEALRLEPGIHRVEEEDREVFLVKAPGIDEPAIHGIVDRLWRQTGRRQ